MEPGTGFVAALRPGVTAYPLRLDAFDVDDADYILVEGGANDFLATSEEITAASDATFKALRGKNANATIVAIGPLVVPRRAESGEYGRVSGAIAAAAQQNGVLYVDPVAEQWLSDESLFFGVVPNSDGYVEFARRLKSDLEQAGLTASCGPTG
nr:SGNH/GDSL hydrolase family protein [Mycobacterium sp. Root135]